MSYKTPPNPRNDDHTFCQTKSNHNKSQIIWKMAYLQNNSSSSLNISNNAAAGKSRARLFDNKDRQMAKRTCGHSNLICNVVIARQSIWKQ